MPENVKPIRAHTELGAEIAWKHNRAKLTKPENTVLIEMSDGSLLFTTQNLFETEYSAKMEDIR